jgi:hypothetical protein
MLQIQYFLPSSSMGAAQPPAPANPAGRARRRRLRLYLVGSEADARHAIDRLHLLGFAERFEWSQRIDIPENGLFIYPDPGDGLHYLQRYRPTIQLDA